MHSVHSRKTRKVITLNNLNQPIGPTKEDVREFGSFLGTLARTATLCPMDILDWRKMDTKDDLWTYTKEKTKEPVSLKEMFVATRARKPGHAYKHSHENTTSKIV
uniref:Uncharacterized protein n=1 Tax=Nicotiana tabacum TaxID=4097 RepID=A0A1S4BWG8_TOBAC|nr:PREDICTED: uncharacterized protein LOC107812599 [Nicotiana tabacum]